MTRRVAAAVVATFAFPGAADASSTRVSVPAPAEGDVSWSEFRVKTSSPGRATIRNARRLGDLRVEVTGQRVSKRVFRVNVLVLNPRSKARAAQRPPAPRISLHSTAGGIAARQTAAVQDVLTGPPSLGEAEQIDRTCGRRTRMRGRSYFPRRRGFLKADRPYRVFRVVACQQDLLEKVLASQERLVRLGAEVPACMGSVRNPDGAANEVSAKLVCTGVDARTIAIRGPTGSRPQTCVGPTGSFCACGPFCAPLPAESACFTDSDGFAKDTLLEFAAGYAEAVNPKNVLGIWVPQGSPVTDGKYAYLRYLLDRT